MPAALRADGRAAQRPLDLHEGIVDPLAGRCVRWPEHLRLLNHTTGELLPGRCRATNLCRYCQKLYVVETVEMLTIDACEYAPQLWAVLTAREHLTRAECRRHLEQLRKAARRRWPDVEWFVQVEFQRRGALHLNLLIKGVPVHERQELHELLVGVWCSRVDAEPVGQWTGEISDAEGVVKYLSKMLAHGLKAEQAPPIGWRGHRTSQTRGYLVRPASVMRVEARRALRVKRAIWRGVDAELAELEVAAAELVTWELRHVNPSTTDLRPTERERGQHTAKGTTEDLAAVPPFVADEVRSSAPALASGGTWRVAGARVRPKGRTAPAAANPLARAAGVHRPVEDDLPSGSDGGRPALGVPT